MARDWFSPIEEFGTRLRQLFESGRAQTLPPHLRFALEDMHERERLLVELQATKSEMLGCLAPALSVDQGRVPRPLSRQEVKDLENSLLAVSVLRSGELLGGGRLFLDRSKLPTRLFAPARAEPLSLANVADDIERLNARIQNLCDELRQLQAEFNSERASR